MIQKRRKRDGVFSSYMDDRNSKEDIKESWGLKHVKKWGLKHFEMGFITFFSILLGYKGKMVGFITFFLILGGV